MTQPVPNHPREEPSSGRVLQTDGVPNWITEELILHTLKIWNPRYKFTLTRDDAIGIILTVGQLYSVLSRG